MWAWLSGEDLSLLHVVPARVVQRGAGIHFPDSAHMAGAVN